MACGLSTALCTDTAPPCNQEVLVLWAPSPGRILSVAGGPPGPAGSVAGRSREGGPFQRFLEGNLVRSRPKRGRYSGLGPPEELACRVAGRASWSLQVVDCT